MGVGRQAHTVARGSSKGTIGYNEMTMINKWILFVVNGFCLNKERRHERWAQNANYNTKNERTEALRGEFIQKN